MQKKTIGEILVEQKFITQQTLDTLLQEGIGPDRIGDTLVERNALKKAQLSHALALQLNLPFINTITEQMADTTLLSRVPLKFLRKHNVAPLMFEGREHIATSDPRDIGPLDDLTMLLSGVSSYIVAPEEVITEAINRYYPLESSKEMMDELKEENESDIDLSGIEEKDITEMANDAPIVKLVNHILFQGVKEDASDIHIEAFEKELRVRYRIDGMMHVKLSPPKRYLGAIVSRIKIMSNLNIAEKRIPQDGRIQIKVSGKAFDVRISILPCNFGERVVMRMLDKTKGAVPIDKLNLSEHNEKVVRTVIERPNGIILVSGPTGSGKTSTLYAILNHLNTPDTNIITVENPVEYTITGINQVQVNEQVGLTFASALRSILRQDPDTVLIGEIRDQETARIATEAALTGHLVLSTIHTNSAPATVTRLIDMGIEPFLVSSALVCVVSQRLIRRLCEKCKKIEKPDADTINRLGLTTEQAKDIVFYGPGKCPECSDTGYKGRAAIHEVMEVGDSLAEMIINKVDASVIKEKAIEEGMTPLTLDGVRCIRLGITSIEEVLAVSYIEEASEDESFTMPEKQGKKAGEKEAPQENEKTPEAEAPAPETSDNSEEK